LRLVFLAMFFQPYCLSFQPVLNIISVQTTILLPEPVCKLPDFFVSVYLHNLQNSSPFS